MSVEELLEKFESAEVLSVSAEQIKWAPPKTEGLIPVMDAKEFFWYATGHWWPQGLGDCAKVSVRYPRLTLCLGRETDPNLDEVVSDGIRYQLGVQDVGVCEKDLLEQSYMPTNLYRGYDKVYAKVLKPG